MVVSDGGGRGLPPRLRFSFLLPLAAALTRCLFPATPAGPRHLYFKALLYVPGSAAAREELSSASTGHGAHRLAWVDAVYRFRYGHARYDTASVATLTALLLHAMRGPYRTAHDTPSRVGGFVPELCPPYATSDLCGPGHPRAMRGLRPVPGAPSSAQLGCMIDDEYRALEPRMGPLAAEEAFLRLARDNPCYGFEVFVGVLLRDAPAHSPLPRRNGGASPLGGGGDDDVQAGRQDVLVCVGHLGVTVVSQMEPLQALEVVDFHEIGSWASDSSNFAFTVLGATRDDTVPGCADVTEGAAATASVGAAAFVAEEGRSVYIETSAAGAIQRALERYVEERVRIAAAAARGSSVGGGSARSEDGSNGVRASGIREDGGSYASGSSSPGSLASHVAAAAAVSPRTSDPLSADFSGDSSAVPRSGGAWGSLPPLVALRAAPQPTWALPDLLPALRSSSSALRTRVSTRLPLPLAKDASPVTPPSRAVAAATVAAVSSAREQQKWSAEEAGALGEGTGALGEGTGALEESFEGPDVWGQNSAVVGGRGVPRSPAAASAAAAAAKAAAAARAAVAAAAAAAAAADEAAAKDEGRLEGGTDSAFVGDTACGSSNLNHNDGSNDDDDDHLAGLPAGWVAARDGDGDVFFYHTLSRVTTWHHPGRNSGLLPTGWHEVVDPLTTERFFYCPASGETTWERPALALSRPPPPPATLPPGWTSATDSSNRVYYFHAARRVTQWEHPGRPSPKPAPV